MTPRAGLTLVEVLVAMGLLGIVLALITTWQTQTLQVSAATTGLAQQLADLNDVTGYVGDRVRAASRVRTGGLTVNAASAQNAGRCDATTPCLAVLVPEEDAGGTTVTRRWLRLVYRVEPRSGWRASDVDKVPDAWADAAANRVVTVREYRDRCTVTAVQDCAAFRASFLDAAFTGMSSALVGDHLSAVTDAGDAIVPFAFDPASATATLAFQAKRHVRGVTTFTPPGGPQTLQVQARNCPADPATGAPRCTP